MYKRNIAIVGGMRNVNVKVGRLLAAALEMNMLLVEDTIEYVNNSDIASLIRDFGTDYYYTLEEEVVNEFRNSDNSVIATTGTMALNPSAIEQLKENCYIILLTADDNTTLRRIDNDVRCFMKNDLIEKRHSLFRNIAVKLAMLSDIVIDTSRIMPDDVVQIAIRQLKEIVGNE